MKEFSDSDPTPPIFSVSCHHTQAEEERYEAQVAHHPELIRRLVADLRKRQPAPPPPDPFHKPETAWTRNAKIYFRWLKNRVPRSRYQALVSAYEQFLLDDWLTLPACRRLSLPPLPHRLLPQEADLPTPRTGGRRPSSENQKRDALIAELKQARADAFTICKKLDLRRYPVPDRWRAEKIDTWKGAYRRKSQNVHKLFSTVAPKR